MLFIERGKRTRYKRSLYLTGLDFARLSCKCYSKRHDSVSDNVLQRLKWTEIIMILVNTYQHQRSLVSTRILDYRNKPDPGSSLPAPILLPTACQEDRINPQPPTQPSVKDST
jgi:hypothetical protein